MRTQKRWWFEVEIPLDGSVDHWLNFCLTGNDEETTIIDALELAGLGDDWNLYYDWVRLYPIEGPSNGSNHI